MSRAHEEPMPPSEVVGAVPIARMGGTSDTAVGPSSPRSGGTEKPPLVRRVATLVLVAGCVFGACVSAVDFWGNVRVFTGVAALSAVICAVTLIFGYWILRRLRPVRPPESRASLVAVAWGFTGAAGLALLANVALSGIWVTTLGVEIATAWDAALTGPINEELLKLVGIVLIALAFPRVVRGPMDGFVVGSLVGLGFQVVENLFYALGAVTQSGGVNGTVPAVQSLVTRVLETGLGTHWALSALTGTAVGLLVAGAWRPGPRRAMTALLLVVTAIGLHLLFNAPVLASSVGSIAKVLLNFAVVMAVYFVLRRAHRSRVLAAVTEESERAGMSRSDAHDLTSRGGRRRALRSVPEADRARAAMLQESLVDIAEERAATRG